MTHPTTAHQNYKLTSICDTSGGGKPNREAISQGIIIII